MDTVSLDWAFDYLSDMLPPSTLHTLRAAISTSPLPTLLTYLHTLTTTTLLPLLTTLASQVATLLSSSPTLVAAATTLLLFLVLYRLLRLLQRILLFWTRLLFRLLFYAAAGLIASAVWQRGVERTAQDLMVFGSRVGGWVMMVVGIWVREYEKAQEMQAQGQPGQGRGYQRQQGGRGRDGWR
ncbi:hypothetical protein C8A05DRAFT_35933 [Staphylotrichum tortipilum]|uniref:Uncharacterized protein n=1 Tax=Staphylotrichum tortipilum TaxID=2831512 RepID=A0AAN6MHT8_9PEZI|nr:hypothetical protein C8A05DRAFT_35933 [Staphylotrichum longicolle]